MLVYCDNCILIYFYDHTGPLQVRASSQLARIAAAGDQIATSDLVRLECRVKPIHLGDVAKLAAFDAFFAQPGVKPIPIATAVLDRATAIRATNGFKLGDSLHLAAAAAGGCASFLTNDNRLATYTGITVDVLP
jgi:predicted nucleic acid-binding protein